VFLIGGFGAAPSLRSYLQKFLIDFSNELKLPYELTLITANVQDRYTLCALLRSCLLLTIRVSPPLHLVLFFELLTKTRARPEWPTPAMVSYVWNHINQRFQKATEPLSQRETRLTANFMSPSLITSWSR
jgi:hypothetical protein